MVGEAAGLARQAAVVGEHAVACSALADRNTLGNSVADADFVGFDGGYGSGSKARTAGSEEAAGSMVGNVVDNVPCCTHNSDYNFGTVVGVGFGAVVPVVVSVAAASYYPVLLH